MPTKDFRVVKDNKKKPVNKKNPIVFGISILILGLIIAAFAIGPLLGGSTQSADSIYLGSYDGKNIEKSKYANDPTYLMSIYDRYQSYYRIDSLDDIQTFKQILYFAYRDTVTMFGFVSEGEKYGVTMPMPVVYKELRTHSRYLENNVFSPKKYEDTLGVYKAMVEKVYKEEAIALKVQKDMFQSARISTAEVDYFNTLGKTEKQFDIIAFNYNELPLDKKIEYGKENSNLFRKIDLSRIIVSSKSRADAIYEKVITDSGLFAEIAKEESLSLLPTERQNGGKLRYPYAFYIREAFDNDEDFESILLMDKDEISPIIKSTRGDTEIYTIYLCHDALREVDFDDPDDILNIYIYLQSNNEDFIRDYFSEKLESVKTLAQENGMYAAAAELDKEVFTTNFFPIIYGNESAFDGSSVFKEPSMENDENASSIISGISTNLSLLKQLNSLSSSEVSEVSLFGSYVVLFSLKDTRESQPGEKTYQKAGISLPLIAASKYVEDWQLKFLTSDKYDDNFESGSNQWWTWEHGPAN